MKVLFLHPDLGIGGAERLIVDAAVALKGKGHDVKIVTNHYDKAHCFKETEDLDITISGAYFPRSILGSMWALCAYIRMFLAALWIVWTMDFDVIVSDQVSFCQLVFRYGAPKARRIFYCHHPDMLLTDRKTVAKTVYRFFLDWLEEFTTGFADVICVNSEYTAKVTKSTFASLKDRPLTVVYPSLNTDVFDKSVDSEEVLDIPSSAEHIFCSLNRFEVKKNITLALEAFSELKNILSPEVYSKCYLVIAGGYDKRNDENITYYEELVDYAKKLEIDEQQVTFLKSPSDQEKISLIKRSRAILYTPDKEHFGIVPIEAMYLGTPVIAVNSGPLETIVPEKTGFLVAQTAAEFAKPMARLVNEPKLRKIAQKEGPKRVRKLFAFEAFANRLDEIVNNVPVQ